MDTRSDFKYKDRRDAGRQLAVLLEDFKDRGDVMVLGLARGGVPVAYEVAGALGAPFDVFLVRKLPVPGQPELAMGALATGDVRVMLDGIVTALRIPDRIVEAVVAEEQFELDRRERVYRCGRPAPEVAGRTVLLVDDGVATGASMRAAASALRVQNPARIVVAVPVASIEACAAFNETMDDVVCLRTPDPFCSVSYWYEEFSPVGDAEIAKLLACSQAADDPAAA